MVTPRVPAPDAGAIVTATATAQESLPLLIAVGASVADRVRLAELVDDVAPLLLVSGLDELRRLLASAHPPPAAREPEPAPRPASRSAPKAARQSGPTGRQPAPIALVADVLTIDPVRSVAQWQGREIALTVLERDLLTRLNAEPLRVWTYEALHQTVWRNRHLQGTADVHSLVKRLRRKLGELGTTVTIDAVRGTGFRLTDHRRPSTGGRRAG